MKHKKSLFQTILIITATIVLFLSFGVMSPFERRYEGRIILKNKEYLKRPYIKRYPQFYLQKRYADVVYNEDIDIEKFMITYSQNNTSIYLKFAATSNLQVGNPISLSYPYYKTSDLVDAVSSDSDKAILESYNGIVHHTKPLITYNYFLDFCMVVWECRLPEESGGGVILLAQILKIIAPDNVIKIWDQPEAITGIIHIDDAGDNSINYSTLQSVYQFPEIGFVVAFKEGQDIETHRFSYTEATDSWSYDTDDYFNIELWAQSNIDLSNKKEASISGRLYNDGISDSVFISFFYLCVLGNDNNLYIYRPSFPKNFALVIDSDMPQETNDIAEPRIKVVENGKILLAYKLKNPISGIYDRIKVHIGIPNNTYALSAFSTHYTFHLIADVTLSDTSIELKCPRLEYLSRENAVLLTFLTEKEIFSLDPVKITWTYGKKIKFDDIYDSEGEIMPISEDDLKSCVLLTDYGNYDSKIGDLYYKNIAYTTERVKRRYETNEEVIEDDNNKLLLCRSFNTALVNEDDIYHNILKGVSDNDIINVEPLIDARFEVTATVLSDNVLFSWDEPINDPLLYAGTYYRIYYWYKDSYNASEKKRNSFPMASSSGEISFPDNISSESNIIYYHTTARIPGGTSYISELFEVEAPVVGE